MRVSDADSYAHVRPVCVCDDCDSHWSDIHCLTPSLSSLEDVVAWFNCTLLCPSMRHPCNSLLDVGFRVVCQIDVVVNQRSSAKMAYTGVTDTFSLHHFASKV
jgi:hypothetical protein